MPVTPRYWYEITYQVSPQYRDEYDRWIPGALIEWLERAEVTVFQAYRKGSGSSRKLRLVFQFDDREKWTTFTRSDVHRANIDRLRGLAVSVDEALWKPTALPVDAGKVENDMSFPDASAEGSWE